MLFSQTNSDRIDPKAQNWEHVAARELRLREQGKKIVSVEECGRVIGKIVLPIDSDIIGRWCGSVYLTRD